jgi:cytochrome c5
MPGPRLRRAERSWYTLYVCVGCVLLAFIGLAALAFKRGTAHAALAGQSAPNPQDIAREKLHAFEQARRRATDFAELPPAERTHGADPYALLALQGGTFLGLLRGASELVVLGQNLEELARAPGPASAKSAVVTAEGDIWVAGEAASKLSRYRFSAGSLTETGSSEVPGVFGISALATGPRGQLYALDERGGRLLSLSPIPRRKTLDPSSTSSDAYQVSATLELGHHPIALERVDNRLLVNLLYDHTLIALELDASGKIVGERARIRHDGPFWGFSGIRNGGALWLAAGGVEDHPLERKDGSFGYIDSFIFLYRLPDERGTKPERIQAINVSALGVVTPKALNLTRDANGNLSLFVSGYGSERALSLNFRADPRAAPEITTRALVPGTNAVLALAPDHWLLSDPLLDAWVSLDATGARVVASEAAKAPRASPEARLGEALFFTTLMAPHNSSEGRLSRFTCETCHFEGYVDGRTHYTGRGNVFATTKPLRGLFNNGPHFSRALDPDLATVSHNEFRVAGKGSGTDPWFSVHTRDYGFLAELGVQSPEIGPEALRQALVSFLMGFSHAANPAVSGRSGFNSVEARGALVFRDRCERCHAARLISADATSRVPFERWPAQIFSAAGAIVWASAEYQQSGVLPYMHERGTRVPSLRRLYAKWPYFTNGSAKSVADVLSRARFDDTRFFHDSVPDSASLLALSAADVKSVAAFLELL